MDIIHNCTEVSKRMFNKVIEYLKLSFFFSWFIVIITVSYLLLPYLLFLCHNMNTEQAKENVFMHSPIAKDTKLLNGKETLIKNKE